MTLPLASPNAASTAKTHPPSDARVRTATVALVGNPNTGKTSLFNALTGYRRHVANYPGVTVDVASGPLRHSTRPIELLDLPGTYSLAAASPDEMIVSQALQGRLPGQPRPDAVLAIVDASNPQRNLYLLSQLLELGLPVVVALNMVDIARRRGIEIDAPRLAERLGIPVIPVVATQPKTVVPLVQAIEGAVYSGAPARHVPPPDMLVREAAGVDPETAEVRARYAWINRILDGAIQRRSPNGPDWSSRIDAVLTQRLAGALTLLLVLYGLFTVIYAASGRAMGVVDGFFRWLGMHAAAGLPPGAVQSLVVDGLIAGVGGVLSFLPQIVILFLFIAILEDCGYLARAAFMVDRLMRPLGLSGRAFIPLLSSFACAVPAILGTRAIADRRERLITILLAPFMSCSARLPIYVLLIGAFVPPRMWLGGWLRLDALVMVAMYLVGLLFAIPVAWLLKRATRAGPASGFLLELPTYKWPQPRTVFQRVYLAGRSFVVRAGTVILLVNLAVWALGYFPHSTATRRAVEQQRVARGWDDATFQSNLAGAHLRDSYLGRLGHMIEPVIRPIGWDWRIGVGVAASFPAREVIIATLGTVCNLGNANEPSASLREAVRQMTRADTGTRLFTLPVALSIMVFFALCAQCASTLAVMRKETGSWLWPSVSLVGMTTLAYLAALGVSVGGRALGW